MPGTIRFPSRAWPALGAGPRDDDEIVLWAARLDLAPDRVGAFASVLTAEERARAGRFRRPLHRDRFIVARGLARVLLASALGEAPERLRFRLGEKGKPHLDPDPGLEFNLSHSHDEFVIALTRRGPVGVDVERLREISDAQQIARRFFAPDEVARLDAGDVDRRSRSFLECWTRKEALIKAQGGGVWLGLDRFVVAFGTEPARVVRIDGHPDAASRWSLLDLEPGSASVGALALESAAPPPVRAGRIDPTAGPVPGLDSRGE